MLRMLHRKAQSADPVADVFWGLTPLKLECYIKICNLNDSETSQ